MTKKRKRYPDLNQKLERPWCYYCERDFDDLKILISHQKAKHFKCERCGRRLNTAGGLSVHMNQVHKETLTHVENANPGRQGLDIEIFGMEGVPTEIVDQHNQQVTQAHFSEEQERARATGNPIRGVFPNGVGSSKRPKANEDLETIEERADKYRTDRKNGVLPLPPAVPEVAANPTPPAVQQPYGVPPAAFPGAAAPSYPPLPFSPTNGAPRPGSIPGQSGVLPPRPAYTAATPGAPGAFPSGADASAIQSSLDDLIAGVQKEVPEKKEDKKSKKDKNMKLIYNDDSISPEEKMAALPRFAEFMRT